MNDGIVRLHCALDVHVVLFGLSPVVLKVARSFAVDEVGGLSPFL